jgi:hypothetical protein
MMSSFTTHAADRAYPARKREQDAAWQARFAAEPTLRMEWMRELAAAGERVRGKR